MTSTDDPDRDRRPTRSRNSQAKTSKLRVQAAVTWSAAARREYSASNEFSRAEIGKIARGAAKRAVIYTRENTSALQPFNEAKAFTLEISFVSDEEMCELNSNYRGKNKPTDVLSFAQTEGEAFPIALEEVLLGDVIIAVGTAQRQAAELKHSLQREVAFLTIHGTLHLCGFDHDTAPRRRVMWKHQDTVFAALYPEESILNSTLRR